MSHSQLCLLFALTRKHRFSPGDLDAAVCAALPETSLAELKALRLELCEILEEIEAHFCTLVDPANLHNIPTAELKTWLADNYPWMDAETLDGAYKEGLARAAL